MLLKCCMQYFSKFEKLSSGHRTGKDQFSFQFQRKAMSKNIQATIHLYSLHMSARLCSKSFKQDFNSMWTENLQMYKLGLKRQRNQRWNCQHLLDHRKRKGILPPSLPSPTHTHTKSTLLTVFKTLTVWITANHAKFKKWEYQITLPEKPVCRQLKMYQLKPDIEQSGSKLGKEYIKAIYFHPAYLTYM